MTARAVPSFVLTSEDERRWFLAEGVARRIFGDEDARSVWQHARVLYHGAVPTDDPDHSGAG